MAYKLRFQSRLHNAWGLAHLQALGPAFPTFLNLFLKPLWYASELPIIPILPFLLPWTVLLIAPSVQSRFPSATPLQQPLLLPPPPSSPFLLLLHLLPHAVLADSCALRTLQHLQQRITQAIFMDLPDPDSSFKHLRLPIKAGVALISACDCGASHTRHFRSNTTGMVRTRFTFTSSWSDMMNPIS